MGGNLDIHDDDDDDDDDDTIVVVVVSRHNGDWRNDDRLK